MPRGGRGGHQHSSRKPVDLTGVVSLAEKNDLLTLVNAITEKLYRDLCTNKLDPNGSTLLDHKTQKEQQVLNTVSLSRSKSRSRL